VILYFPFVRYFTLEWAVNSIMRFSYQEIELTRCRIER